MGNSAEFVALYDKIHNQRLEIKRLEKELERAKVAYAKRGVYMRAEREIASERKHEILRLLAFYKGKFMQQNFGRSFQWRIT